MAEFNVNTLDSFFKKRDWSGAADYLSTLKASSPQKQDALNIKIEELRKTAEKERSLLQNMTPKEQEAYKFISSYRSNTPITENNYGDAYANFLNDLKATDGISPGGRNVKGEDISTLRIELNDDNTYSNYLSKLGLTTDDISKEDVKVKQDNNTGKWIIDIPKDNVRISEFYAKALDLDETVNIGFSGTGAPATVKGNYSIKGITSSNIVLNDSQFNSSNLYRAYLTLKDAENIQNKAIEKQKTTFTEDIVVTQFLGAGQANAYKRMQNGAISMDDYKKIVEERTNAYNNLLTHVGLANYKVYSSQESDDDKKGLVFKEVKEKDKDEIMKYILVGIQENRLSYAAAMHEGETGTYITIRPKTDEKSNIASGEYAKPIRIFIPGLFKSSCDESFNSDTKQMAVKDNADMRRWNYGKFLKNGEYVGYDKNIGAYKLEKDEKGNKVKTAISTEEILQKLNEENAINATVSRLTSYLDNKGNPITYTENGKVKTYDIEQLAKLAANVTTNESYPKGKYSDADRLLYANNIYNTILKELSNRFYKQNKE